MSEPLLRVSGVSKKFGGIVANRDVSLRAERGEIVGLIGPNGSGKSTLFNLICGASPADSGEIVFDGLPLLPLSPPQIARAGLIRTFQQTRVYRGMTCIDNMCISSAKGDWLSPPPPSAVADAMELLAFVGLEKKRDHPAGALSFGQQKLLELAMALIARPRLLLLDEPTAGINPTLINGVLARLKTVNEQFGITLLVIEHNMRVMMSLAQRVYCLAHGEMLAEGGADEVRNNPRVLDAYLGRQ